VGGNARMVEISVLGRVAGAILPPVPDGFVLPNDTAPFDPRPNLRGVPDNHRVRGLFFNSIIDVAKRRGIVVPRIHDYVDFKHYPVREWMELVLGAARLCYPQLSLRGGLRNLGRYAYPSFATSMVGRVTFGILGDDLARIMNIASKGYACSLTHARVTVVSATAQSVRARFEHSYGFIDSYQVGVFEGVFQACNRAGEVHVRVDSVCEGEIFARWV
jgi:uncharacterized protein (TIGR02265 family)